MIRSRLAAAKHIGFVGLGSMGSGFIEAVRETNPGAIGQVNRKRHLHASMESCMFVPTCACMPSCMQ